MKSKNEKIIYVCEECGYTSPKWLGKCPQCEQWDSFAEQLAPAKGSKTKHSSERGSSAIPLSEVSTEGYVRLPTGFAELDRVLGGGLVPGSTNLLGGEPGIGKSTILLQACGNLSFNGVPCFYVTGEESAVQIKRRAERLGINIENIIICTETDVHKILHNIRAISPQLVIIDSIQTVFEPDLGSFPGTIGQIRETTAQFIDYAKSSEAIFVLSGHITKDGSIAGPKLLEHMVDTVMYFEGDKDFIYRIIRGVKNRFGPAGEIGVFEMRSEGLAEVADPSGVFLSNSGAGSGSVVTAMLEGSRPFLVEVQALVVPTGYSVSQKVSVGFDSRKLSLIAAIAEKKGNVRLTGMDLFVKILGGVRAEEAAVDLAVALALYSSITETDILPGTIAFGELGLSGEIRGVSSPDRRIAEAVRMGFNNLIIPYSNVSQLTHHSKINIIGVKHLQEAFKTLSAK